MSTLRPIQITVNCAGPTEPGGSVVLAHLSRAAADLIAAGRSREPTRPWLGLTTEEEESWSARVTAGGPAEKAGVRRGDLVVGISGDAAKNLADFYRKVWAKGSAGVTVPLDVLRENQLRRFEVQSMDRYDHLKLDPTV